MSTTPSDAAAQVPVPVKPTGGPGPRKVIAVVVDEHDPRDMRYRL